MKLTIEDGRDSFYTFDTNRILLLTATDEEQINQVEFSTEENGETVSWTSDVLTGEDGIKYVQVPNEFLNGNYSRLVCYYVALDSKGEYTRQKEVFRIRARQEPEDYFLSYSERTTFASIKALTEQYKTNASNSADLARRYAEESEDVNVETGTYSSKHWSAKSEKKFQEIKDYVGSASDPESALGSIESARASAVSDVNKQKTDSIEAVRTYTSNTAIPYVSQYIEGTAKPALKTYGEQQVNSYVNGTSKPELDRYVNNEKKQVLDNYTAEKKSELDNYTETDKKQVLDSYTENEKKAELDSHAEVLKGQLDAHTVAKTGELNEYTTGLKSELDGYTTAKEQDISEFTEQKKAEVQGVYQTDLNELKGDLGYETKIGKNVLDISQEKLITSNPTGTQKYGVKIDHLDGDYTISFTPKTSLGYYPTARTIRDGVISTDYVEAINGTILTIQKGDSLILYIGNAGVKMSDVFGNIQLEKGTTATAYEPFSSVTDVFRIKDLEERVTSVETNDDIVAEMISAYDSHGIFESNIEVALSENGMDVYYCSNCNKIVARYTVNSLLGSIGRTIRLESDGKGSLAYVDFEHNTIGFASVLSSYTTNDSITKLTESVVPFQFVSGRDYIIEDIIIEDTQTLTVRDAFSSEYFTVTRRLTSYNMRNGVYKSIPIGDGITLVSVKGYFLQPKNPKVAIFGDSFVEGFFPYRYGTLLKRELKGNVYLDSNSGCDTANGVARLEYAKKYINPKYIILALGTNDTIFSTWKWSIQECLKVVEEIGAIPILVTITFWNSDAHNEMAKQANAWIKASGYKYVDFNRLTSVDYLCETKNTSMFRSDGTHPTNETFKLMYDLLHCDVPEIFND